MTTWKELHFHKAASELNNFNRRRHDGGVTPNRRVVATAQHFIGLLIKSAIKYPCPQTMMTYDGELIGLQWIDEAVGYLTVNFDTAGELSYYLEGPDEIGEGEGDDDIPFDSIPLPILEKLKEFSLLVT